MTATGVVAPPTASTSASAAGGGLAIATRGLSKRYGSVLALDRLDLDVPAGSVFGFLGPNGAGKTTTLRLLTGLGHPSEGRATVGGLEIGRDAVALARRIGYLDQSPRYPGWMRGREVLELAGRLHGLAGPALRARVEDVLDLVGLSDAGERRVAGYSGGMRQRLGIGQAMVQQPPVLFLDEPVSALDPEGRRDVLGLIAGLRGRATVFMSTHILNDVERVCDRVGIIDHGRLIAESGMDDLLERFARPIYELDPEPDQDSRVDSAAASLRGASWASDVRVDRGRMWVTVADTAAASASILPLVAATGLRLARFERLRPTLEDVFLQLVNGGAPTGEPDQEVGP